MAIYTNMTKTTPKKPLFLKRLLSGLLCLAFFMTTILPVSYAQEIFLPPPGSMVALSPGFNPPSLRGIKVYTDNPFLFDFILDNGQSKTNGDEKEASKLVKYFLASLTTPENEMWVNLSPYEKDRIVPESFGRTEMGRDLLAQDYMLKQITASLIYPEDELGKKFWARIREEAQKKFGTSEIPISTFNKVWIVPNKAQVYENPQTASAYIIESNLKVMLEEDYVALSMSSPQSLGGNAPIKNGFPLKASGNDKVEGKVTNALGSQIIREIVIPALTKEVNEGKNFAQLRQIYNSLILAAWYKKKIKDSILSQVYVDKNKVAGVNIDDPNEKQIIYEQYLEAFKKGAYNYIKEEYDPATQETIPKKYFSGGFAANKLVLGISRDENSLSASSSIENGKGLQVILESTDRIDNQSQPGETLSADKSAKDAMASSAIEAEPFLKSLKSLINQLPKGKNGQPPWKVASLDIKNIVRKVKEEDGKEREVEEKLFIVKFNNSGFFPTIRTTVKVVVENDKIVDITFDDTLINLSERNVQFMAVIFMWLLDEHIFPIFTSWQKVESNGSDRDFIRKLARIWKVSVVTEKGLIKSVTSLGGDPTWATIEIDPQIFDKNKISASIKNSHPYIEPYGHGTERAKPNSKETTDATLKPIETPGATPTPEGTTGATSTPEETTGAIPDSEKTKGGIDFNAAKLNVETKTTGGEINFAVDPQQLLELQNVPGFTPVIIHMQPTINVRIFLGLKEMADNPLAISKVP